MVALAALLACGSVPMWAATKGPDEGGYTATDESVYSFVDISGSSGGSGLLSGTDDGTAVLTLPFPFRFYGESRTLACVSTNGALYFVTSVGECSGFDGDFANTDLAAAPVPNDRPAILPFWSDLTFQVPGAGAVLYQTLGASPERRFVIQWNDAYPQGSANPVTFQIILTEGTGGIIFQYKTVDLGAGNPAHNGAQATVGICNANGRTTGQCLPWSYNAPVLHGSQAILIYTKTTPTITWAKPADITYGTALGPTQLNATASVPGTFVYTPPAGTVLPVGADQPLEVTFTPADAIHNTTASKTVMITVTAGTTPGRINGDGFINNSGRWYQFEFTVSERGNGQERGSLRLQVFDHSKPGNREEQEHRRDDDRDHARRGGRLDVFTTTQIDSIVFSDTSGTRPGRSAQPIIDTVAFAGRGRWNGGAGYTFEARAIDAGEPGRDRDTFSITVRNRRGVVVAAVSGTLDGGNIQSFRVRK
jgi:hypothetical protein